MGILIPVVINVIALWITALVVPGIDLGDGNAGRTLLTVLLIAVVFGPINEMLKPIEKVIESFRIYILYVLTLLLIALVVNALLFWLTDWVAHQLDLPFTIDAFWPAFWGAIVMALVSWLLSMLMLERRRADDGPLPE